MAYTHITYTKLYPKSYKIYHIYDIIWLWQLGSLDFNLAIILRNEKFYP